MRNQPTTKPIGVDYILEKVRESLAGSGYTVEEKENWISNLIHCLEEMRIDIRDMVEDSE